MEGSRSTSWIDAALRALPIVVTLAGIGAITANVSAQDEAVAGEPARPAERAGQETPSTPEPTPEPAPDETAGVTETPPLSEEVPFRFESHPPGLALTLVTGEGYDEHGTFALGYGPAAGVGVRRVSPEDSRRLCTSPCQGRLPPGIHLFGLTHPSHAVWVALPPLSLRSGEPMAIRGYLIDRSADRLGGALFLVVGGLSGLGGVLAGMAMMISSQDVLGTTEGTAGMGLVIGSGLLLMLALAVGLPLAFEVDRAWVVGFAAE